MFNFFGPKVRYVDLMLIGDHNFGLSVENCFPTCLGFKNY